MFAARALTFFITMSWPFPFVSIGLCSLVHALPLKLMFLFVYYLVFACYVLCRHTHTHTPNWDPNKHNDKNIDNSGHCHRPGNFMKNVQFSVIDKRNRSVTMNVKCLFNSISRAMFSLWRVFNDMVCQWKQSNEKKRPAWNICFKNV